MLTLSLCLGQHIDGLLGAVVRSGDKYFFALELILKFLFEQWHNNIPQSFPCSLIGIFLELNLDYFVVLDDKIFQAKH